jgi:hypothetical protein
MKMIEKIGAQGDVLFVRVERVPEGLAEVPDACGKHVVGHSETGHDHYVSAAESKLFRGQEPFTCFLQVAGHGCEVVHNRSFDTHESLFLPPGQYLVRQQREYTPEGWRKVQD